MMHMWMWFGYDLGDFLFPGLEVNTQWAFALTWILLFFVALFFEASKVYLARVQRSAQRKLYPYRSDERRNLLCEREQGTMDASTSRNTSTATVDRWASLRVRISVNLFQTTVFLVHNVVGYLLMLAVMLYNVHLLLSVVFGMMLGYFLFGTKLTRLQMQCFGTKRMVICTPECDDTAADSIAPHLLDSTASSESDFFICQTRTCIQPSHYFPANSRDGEASSSQAVHATCHYGAKRCPSKVARAKTQQHAGMSSHCHHAESEKEDSPSVEDAQLLRTERQGCCKKKQEPPPVEETSSQVDINVVEAKKSCCKKERSSAEEKELQERENSPHITCCHSGKSVPAESQEQIII